MSSADDAAVSGYYGRDDLGTVILDALQAAGKNLDALTPADLAPMDEFHIRGREATLELARLAGLAPTDRVLDVGGGLGGPARTLASTIGCVVTVLDLTEEFCRVGEMLTARTGLGQQVRFEHGSALELPFAAASFDVVWTQHSSMNVADKERLYAEIHRVLRPGGRLALFEVLAGFVQPIHFPVPWAADAAISCLQPPQELRALLRATGFTEVAWVDLSRPSLEWFRRVAAARPNPAAPPPLGPHVLLGPLFGAAVRNFARNLEEQRVAVVQAVLERS